MSKIFYSAEEFLDHLDKLAHPKFNFLNLPERWITRDDYAIGSAQWWGEWALYKLTGFCDHEQLGGWVRHGRACRDAWEAEYGIVHARLRDQELWVQI